MSTTRLYQTISRLSRRRFSQLGAASFAGLLLPSCQDADRALGKKLIDRTDASGGVLSTAQAATKTPSCDNHAETPSQTAGPFYKPDTPERHNLLPTDATDEVFVLTGIVMDARCQPQAGAIIDFWHADEKGNYDNDGFAFRGHQFTDANGAYRLETIVPGLYPGRTRHIHVKVQGPDTPLLTTQLYFPDNPGNASDGIYNAALLMTVEASGDGMTGSFDFVL